MGGVIGGLSAKIAFAAGSLLLASRIGTHRTPATIDPSLPETRVSAAFAQKIGTGSQPRYVDIGRTTIRLTEVAAVADAAPPMIIGADVLREIALRVDLKRMRVDVLDRGQLRRAAKGQVPIAVSVDAAKCVTIDAIGPDAAPITVALIATRADAGPVDAKITVGGMQLDAVPLPRGRCAASRLGLDWSSFAGRTVLLDLGQGRLWIS